jgi:hypothetical protein
MAGLAIALLLLFGATLLSRRSKPTAEVEFVPVEAIFKDPNALGRLRMKLMSFLRRAKVDVMVEVVASERLGSGAHALFMRENRSATTNEVSAWLLKDEDLTALAKAFELRREQRITAPRIITTEGMMGTFSISSSQTRGGTNYEAGMETRIIAQRAGDRTDLLLGFRSTGFESAVGGGTTNAIVQTNAYFALRVQMPPEERAIILVEQEGGKPPLVISVQASFQIP